MTYSHEVERMCPLTKGPHHGPGPHSGGRPLGKSL